MPQGPVRVAIADDSTTIYSDDYRIGWEWGFRQLGCEVQVFDVGALRQVGTTVASPYRSTAMKIVPKGIADQISAWQPHLVWCHHGKAASAAGFLDHLRRRCGGVVAVYLCDEPYECGWTLLVSPHFDYVFTMDPCTVLAHQRARGNISDHVFYLPPAANTEHFRPLPYENRTLPALFLGNAELTPRSGWLDPVEDAIPGARILYRAEVRQGRRVAAAKGDQRWVPYSDHPALYGSCLVGLNVHRSPWITQECYEKRIVNRSRSWPSPNGTQLCSSPKEFGTGIWNDCNLPAAHVNPRFFEMAACGTLVVNDDSRFELARMFPMAPRAATPEKFLELVRYYLEHRDEAEMIGATCSILVSSRHSYRHRAAEVLVRAGLRDASEVAQSCYLGPPEDWLTTQQFGWLSESSPSDLTGPSDGWSPQLGMSLTRTFGVASAGI